VAKPKWKKPHVPNLKKVLKTARDAARATAIETLEDYAHEQREDFVGRIQDQRFASFKKILYPESGTNLSPRWLATKQAWNADLRTMIATGHYTESIKVFKKGRLQRGPYEFRIGFHHSAKARRLDGTIAPILLKDLARVHEHGSVKMKIPERPHWGPQGNRMRRDRGKTRRRINEAIAERLIDKLPDDFVWLI
jgi:hypothetical protein